jgi:hypothetical protein
MRALFTVGLCAILAPSAYSQTSQTGTFVGTVSRDSVGTAVGQAQVQLPQLNLSATTNYQGEFRIPNIPAGRYGIAVRAVGFQLLVDSIDVQAGATVDGDIILTPVPVNLAAQHTTAAVEKYLPPGIAEMEERRKTGLGGHFVTDSALRANDGRKLTYMLAAVAGIHQVLSSAGPAIFIANGRPVGKGGGCTLPPGMRGPSPSCDFPSGQCYVDLYINGARYFVGPANALNPPPDFNSMWNAEYSGIEYYSGAATIPPQYNATSGSGCGVMLLSTRRTP